MTYCRRCVSIIESCILHYFYNELFSRSNKNIVRPCKVWLGSVLVIKILLKTAQLLSRQFLSGSYLCIIYFLFLKGKDTSAIPQPSVQHLVYIFRILSCLHKCFSHF